MSSWLPSPEQQADLTPELNRPDSLSGHDHDVVEEPISPGPFLASYSPDPYNGRLPYHSLERVLSLVDLDILEELEHFRSHLADLTSSLTLSGSSSQGHSSQPRHLSSPLGSQSAISETEMAHPYRSTRGADVSTQDILEDLELDEGNFWTGWLSPLFVLFLWFASCAGIGLGIWWLVFPGEPYRSTALNGVPEDSPDSTLSSEPTPTPPPPLPDLQSLPLIPVRVADQPLFRDDLPPSAPEEPISTSLAPTRRRFLDSLPVNDGVEPLQETVNWLDALQRETSYLAGSVTNPDPPPGISRLSLSLPPAAPTDPLTLSAAADADEITQTDGLSLGVVPTVSETLGPNRGEGTFVVLMTYQGDNSLEIARQLSQDAFVKDVAGEKYVQLAAFQQLEYARYMAENLKQRGVPVMISQHQ
jgi:hypothetical protein